MDLGGVAARIDRLVQKYNTRPFRAEHCGLGVCVSLYIHRSTGTPGVCGRKKLDGGASCSNQNPNYSTDRSPPPVPTVSQTALLESRAFRRVEPPERPSSVRSAYSDRDPSECQVFSLDSWLRWRVFTRSKQSIGGHGGQDFLPHTKVGVMPPDIESIRIPLAQLRAEAKHQVNPLELAGPVSDRRGDLALRHRCAGQRAGRPELLCRNRAIARKGAVARQ